MYVREWVRVKPGVHTNDFAPIHGRRARIHTAPVFLRRCVNTGAPTVNRGEIVSMYAGLKGVHVCV